MIFPRLYRDIGIRWLIATAKVAVLFGLLLFLLSFCSCSSARRTDSLAVSSSDTVSVVSAGYDSVGVNTSESSWFSQVIKISGLEILFPVPTACSIPDTADMVSRSPAPSPSRIRIDALEIDSASGKEASSARDSVSSESKAEKAVSVSESSQVKIRSPDAAKWQVILVLVFVLLLISFTAWHLYNAQRPAPNA